MCLNVCLNLHPTNAGLFVCQLHTSSYFFPNPLSVSWKSFSILSLCQSLSFSISINLFYVFINFPLSVSLCVNLSLSAYQSISSCNSLCISLYLTSLTIFQFINLSFLSIVVFLYVYQSSLFLHQSLAVIILFA